MSDKATIPDDIATLSFEDAMAALEQIVNRLESGNAPLEDSIDLYSRGTMLRQHCEARLRDAQSRIEKLSFDNAGQPAGTQPLDVD